MTKRDYYEILGVGKQSSKAEIKKAYKKLALKHHPDKGGDAEQFKELSEAYAVLVDDNKRSQYDRFGHAGFDQRYSQEDIFRNANFDDIFRDIFGGESGSIFDMFFGGSHRGRRQRRGSDLRYDLEISFEEAAFGVEKKLRIPKLVNCEECNGTGAENESLITCDGCQGTGQVRKTSRSVFGMFTQIGECSKCNGFGRLAKERCKTCKGEGVVQKNKELKIKIPSGVDSGSRLRISGEGEAVPNGESGDLYVVMHVKPHDFFERNENDLCLTYPVSFSQAALGDKIEIPTLKEKMKIKIPSGTQSNTIFRLRGKGIQGFDGDVGDLLVRIIVKTPSTLSKKQKELFNLLAKENKEKLHIEKGFFEKVRDVFN